MAKLSYSSAFGLKRGHDDFDNDPDVNVDIDTAGSTGTEDVEDVKLADTFLDAVAAESLTFKSASGT